MTVRIGSMATQWANSEIVYTAIGMHITDVASKAESKLINLSVDGNSKFTIDKTGLFRITPDLPSNSNSAIFTVINSGDEIVTITPNTWQNYANVVMTGSTNYVKSYVEGLQYINMGGPGELVLDLGVASTFIVDQWPAGTEGAITKITFKKPDTIVTDYYRSYSCSVLFRGNIFISDAVWSSANVMWPGGYGRSTVDQTIFNFINTTITGDQNEFPSNTWIAMNGGTGFKTV